MKYTRVIFFIWLLWGAIILGFQSFATARLVPQFPDRALAWTTTETQSRDYQNGRPYLLEPFMNNQVAWDSEYYLAIAVGGYDDPKSPHLTPLGLSTSVVDHTVTQSGSSFSKNISLSYAFFPFYPWTMRIFAIPLSVFGLNEIATATLAGILVSALGTLLGMLALFDLARDSLGKDGALRAAFYLIIFPTGFFLIQVYTEGLFIGLTFACLAALKRKQWLIAALLAICATLTRAVGVLLVIPMMALWFRSGEWMDLDLEWRQIFHQGIPHRPLLRAMLAFAPLITFAIWKFSYLGFAFDYVQANFFGRGFMTLGNAFYSWAEAFRTMLQASNLQHTAYYLTEFLGLAIGIAACFAVWKTHPEVAWFSLAVMIVSWGSGPAQGMHRYILGAPAVFIALAYWGANPIFDRAWTIFSVLLMSLLSMLFAFNMWVA